MRKDFWEQSSTNDIVVISTQTDNIQMSEPTYPDSITYFEVLSTRPHWLQISKNGSDAICIQRVTIGSAANPDGPENMNNGSFWIDNPCKNDISLYRGIPCRNQSIKFDVSRNLYFHLK